MNKFMPPPPQFRPVGSIGLDQNQKWEVITKGDFLCWFETHIKPIFENAVEVYGWKGVPHNDEKWIFSEDPATEDTHSALLINIQEIKPQSAEDERKEMVIALEGFLEKACKYLEKK